VAPISHSGSSDFGKLPLSFEPNEGQPPLGSYPSVRFQAHAPGGTLFFTPNEVVLSLSRSSSSPTAPQAAFDVTHERRVLSAELKVLSAHSALSTTVPDHLDGPGARADISQPPRCRGGPCVAA